MTKPRLNLSLTTVENGGLLVEERLSPCRQYVFTSPRGFYEWLCQEMGTNAKPDSPTHDGRVVVDANKLERLEKIEAAAIRLIADYGTTHFTLFVKEALER